MLAEENNQQSPAMIELRAGAFHMLLKSLGSFLVGRKVALRLALAAFLLSGTVYAAPDQVTNIFKPLSTPAESVYQAALLTLAICGVIFLIVGGLLAYTSSES